MPTGLIVPNYLSDAIYAAIDKQLAACPEVTEHREAIYQDLLAYFYEHGTIPKFTLAVGEKNQ